MSDKPKCCGKIVVDKLWYETAPCTRNASVERDGKHYCGTHDPVKKAEKQAKSNAKARSEFDADMKRIQMSNAAPDLFEACARLVGSLSVMVTDPDSCDDVLFAREAMRKAKGAKP